MNINNQITPAVVHSPRAKASKPSSQKEASPTPSLRIVDQFVAGSNEFSHGDKVGYTARAEGFRGALKRVDRNSNHPESNTHKNALGALSTRSLSADQAKQVIYDVNSLEFASILTEASGHLDQLSERGDRNSVANFSWGQSGARQASNLYKRASKAWDQELPETERRASFQVASNLASAYDLDTQKLLHDDPKIHGPERQKLQQALLEHSTEAASDPRLSSYKAKWDRAVKRYEGNNNSVVIVAGNEGAAATEMSRENHGLQVTLPEGSTRSILENDEVTSVGATRWFRKDGELKEYVANYSSRSSGIDVYASGSLAHPFDPTAEPQKGTSLAAPKVSAAMSELHRLNPEMSSSQVEALMLQSLTREFPTRSGASVQVLDFQKNFEFLQNNTY